MELFYANIGIPALPQPARLQAGLGILIGMFERVGLHTNVKKIVRIICKLFQIIGGK